MDMNVQLVEWTTSQDAANLGADIPEGFETAAALDKATVELITAARAFHAEHGRRVQEITISPPSVHTLEAVHGLLGDLTPYYYELAVMDAAGPVKFRIRDEHNWDAFIEADVVLS